MMNRRGFLSLGMGAILAAKVAPFVVTTSGVLMPIKQRLIVPTIWDPLAQGIGRYDLKEYAKPLYGAFTYLERQPCRADSSRVLVALFDKPVDIQSGDELAISYKLE